MKNDVKKKRKFKLSRLFRNTQFILIMSLVLSFTIWVNMSLSDDNESTSTIMNIPVQINLSENAIESGLQIFSGQEQFASVNVTGNRVALGNLSSEDIIVAADNAGTISAPGTYPLSLTARKANSSDNFQITSTVSPSVITIYVDRADKAVFELENKITYKVKEGYHSSVALSTDKITIQGPESEVSKIHSVAIEGNIVRELDANREIEYEVKLYDYTGKVYTNNMLTLSLDYVTAVFTVQPKKEVSLSVAYKNKPSGFDVDSFVTVDPSVITIAGPQGIIDNTTSVSTADLDFSTIKNNKTTKKLEINLPKKCTNLSEVEFAEVTLDFRSMKSKKVSVSSFKVENLADNYNYDVTTENLQVTVIGPKGLLKDVKSSDIVCVIDASEVEGTTGSISLPVRVIINNNNSCWIYGSYKANVSFKEK